MRSPYVKIPIAAVQDAALSLMGTRDNAFRQATELYKRMELVKGVLRTCPCLTRRPYSLNLNQRPLPRIA